MSNESFDTIVIGGGQAGLAMGYYLKRMGLDFVILEAEPRVGETWRRRWDSLRLFTPAKFDGLPGMPFPGEDFYFPTKDETADYLERYMQVFELPVRFSTRIDSISRIDGKYVLSSGSGRYSADRVVVATGAFREPLLPDWAARLDPSVVRLHSADYRNPSQVPEGKALLVGAGNSGAEIALELASSGRTVLLAGRDTGRIPAERLGRLFGGKPYWWMIGKLLSEDTPIGRKLKRRSLYHGSPLIRVKPDEISRAGVERVPRVAGEKNGKPLLEDGRILDVQTVVWTTGFRPGFDWITAAILDDHGYPVHHRGAAVNAPGLYFLGLHFQHALNSALLGGVGADADWIARRIEREIRKTPGATAAPVVRRRGDRFHRPAGWGIAPSR